MMAEIFEQLEAIRSDLQLYYHQELHLTAREAEIMFHILLDSRSKSIAKRLNMSHRTVEAHLNCIRAKLQCHSIVELAVIGLFAPINRKSEI